MIAVTVSKKDGQIERIEIKGHAAYATKGYDIYCSAVSSLFLCGASSLEKEGYSFIEKSGYASLKVEKEPSEHDKVVLEVISNGLEVLADNYPKYIGFKEENL